MTKSKKLAVADAINPGTGAIDLMGAMCYVTEHLNMETDIKKGGLYHELPGGMQARLKKFGIPERYIADFLLLLQEVGIVRRHGGGHHVHWEVSCMTYFEAFATVAVVKRSLECLTERHAKNEELRRLKARLERFEKTPPTHSPAVSTVIAEDPDYITHMAEMVAEVEKLHLKDVEKTARITTLEAELASRPKVDAKASMDALVERFKKSASAS